MIAPCPASRRGTDATVPMPPGLVSVNDAPVNRRRRAVLARARDELFVASRESREIELVGVANNRHDQETRAVLAFAIDRETEMDARLHTHAARRFVAAERIGDVRRVVRRRAPARTR